MMYPYMTLADETEIVHSEMFEKLLHRIKKEHSLLNNTSRIIMTNFNAFHPSVP